MMLCLVSGEPYVRYVIAASPDAAEKAVNTSRYPRNAPWENGEAALARWSNQPDVMRRRYALYGVRVVARLTVVPAHAI